MRLSLKPLSRQTLVITGASSGNGLATAYRAAMRGARVMLVARDEAALARIAAEIRGAGGIADHIAADVGDEGEVAAVAARTLERFGGFDTWVNNAGVGIYGELEAISTADHARLFQTNYWGVVFGSLAAVRHFRERGAAGALINVGSINSDMPSPLLSAYTASKHAVKGFTDSLRLELMAARAPVSVTLIKPAAIGTPFPRHARNITGHPARLPRPLYAPGLVADAILHAAEHPARSITVGGGGKVQVFGAQIFPRLFDVIGSRMEPALIDRSTAQVPADGNLYAPAGGEGLEEGDQRGRRVSLYTAAKTAPPGVVPAVAAFLAIATGAAVLAARKAR